MRSLVIGLSLVPLAAAPLHAAPIHARLSAGGLEFVQEQLPTFIPTHVEPPPMTFEMWTCDGEDPATFTQRNTVVDLSIDAFDLSLPAPGALRVDLTFSAWADGEAYLDQVYFCNGEETCDDSISIYNARAVADFSIDVVNGQPVVTVSNVSLELADEDISVTVSNCPPDDIVNTLVSYARDWALQAALDLAESVAANVVGPKLEEILAGFVSYEGSAGAADFEARLVDVVLATNGIGIQGDLDLTSMFPPAACLPSDPGEPSPHAGAAPDLASGVDAHVGLAVNLGLVDDGLYHIWREGFMCIDPSTLGAFGLDVDLAHVGDLLPGFEDGTTFTFEAMLAEPPAVTGSPSDAAKLSMVIRGLEADLIAIPPAGSENETRRLHLELDATVTASVVLDPAINAIAAQVDSVVLDRFEVLDEIGLDQLGMDYARLRQLMEERMMPKMIAEMGSIPLTGPVFGGIADTYAILREVRTTDAYVYAKADLFRAPANDFGAPDTLIADAPVRPVAPKNAKVLLGGSDAEIPTELLKYRVSVDGVSAEPTFVRLVSSLGEVGVTRTVRVEARAIDLAGNEDATPASVELTVDGVLPTLNVPDTLSNTIDTATPTIHWVASDDLTPVDQLGAKIEVFTVTPQAATLVEEIELAPGTTEFTADLDAGKQYRLVVTVSDEAGNTAHESMIFAVSPDAAGGCGCTAGAAGGPSPWAALLLLAVIAPVIRRRK